MRFHYKTLAYKTKRKRPERVASLFSTTMCQLLSSRSLNCLSSLNYLCLNCFSSLNNLNGVLAAGVLAALFLAALVAAAHCNESNSYDKKHFLHTFKKCFKIWSFGIVESRKRAYTRLAQTFINLLIIKLYFTFFFRLFAKNGAKVLTFLHISKKNCNFAQ